MNPDANSATITPGAIAAALSHETEVAEALSAEIAMIGKAVRVMRSPNALTACAAHSLRKSWCDHSDASDSPFEIVPFTDC